MIDSKVRTVQYVRDIPEVSKWLDILEKKGQGTFASVFSVQIKDNHESKKTYALKMLIPTVDIRRIENEIRILRRLGGRNNVIRLHTACRIRDHVFLLMPFVHIIPFSDYYLTADECEITRYMRNLLIALAYIHRYKIIHRDIKPTNFLLDQPTKRFYLVDFGLAHSAICGDVDDDWEKQCDAIESRLQKSNGRKRHFRRSSPRKQQTSPRIPVSDIPKTDCVNSKPQIHNKGVTRTCSSQSVRSDVSTEHRDARSHMKSTPSSGPSLTSSSNAQSGGCVCGFRLTVCRGCRQLPRSTAARRGGTLGFRPPEVMMRYVAQTTAVDVWAAGVIFLSFLCGRYPFIKVDDDLDVLHTFTHLVGYERMQACAKNLGRRILMDPKPPAMEATESPACWLKARCVSIRRLEKKLVGLPPLLSKSADKKNRSTVDSGKSSIAVLPANHVFSNAAYDLAARLLDPNPHTRITANEALRHPFFKEETNLKENIPTTTVT